MRSIAVIGALFSAVSVQAETWRTFAGGFGSRWNTIGHHGHDQPCDPVPAGAPDCDAVDFERANLDDSIGFRAGVERDFFRRGPLHLVAGADGSVSHTEFNVSQRDFSLISTSVFGGADLAFRRFKVGARYGGGVYTTTLRDHPSLLRFSEIGIQIPLTEGAAIRIARRHFALQRMRAAPSREIAAMIVADGRGSGGAMWELGAATGYTRPGTGLGGDRELRVTAVNRTSALRALGTKGLQLEFSWSSTAHESAVPSSFRGYADNYRSKTIEGYGVALSYLRAVGASPALQWRWTGGVEVSDWRDEHRLLTRDNAELVAGVELAVTAGAALRLRLKPRWAFEATVQQIYWKGIDLGEARLTIGIVLTN